MFNSSLIYELSVLKKQALPLLQEITNAEPEYAEAKRLAEFLKYFEEVDEGLIPQNSLLREFVGGSIFGDQIKYLQCAFKINAFCNMFKSRYLLTRVEI